MSKHTPGPWFVESSDKTPIYVSPVDRHEQIAICNVMVIDEDGDSDSGEWFNGDQTKANARLIAAAPDLLAALLSLVENAEQRAFEEWLQRASPSGDVDSVHAQWLDSGDCLEFTESWAVQLDAIDKARVKP